MEPDIDDGRPELKGLDTVLDALTGEDFPMDKENLYYSVGDIEVQDRNGRPVPMRTILDKIAQQRFDSLGQAVTAIKHALREPVQPSL